MLALKTLVVTAVLAAITPAMAAPIFIDFEDSPVEPAAVGNSYETKFGVVFTDNAFTIHSNKSSPTPTNGGNFVRYGDSSKAALGLFSTAGATSADFYINVAAGFGEKFSMLYTTTGAAGGFDFVELFSGENGTGGPINAGTRPNPDKPGEMIPGEALVKQGPCVDPSGLSQPGLSCTWGEISLNFTGTAKSVHVSGVSGVYFFDNMNFGSLATTPPPTTVPEPGGIALSLAALGAMAWTRKRFQS